MFAPVIFDEEHARRYADARGEFLGRFLQEVRGPLGLQTALDVGCGIGYFSGRLQEMGFQVVALDGRTENIAQAARRYPGIEFHVADVEDARIQELGAFDLVLCFGLLYHLENPLRAVRNLRALTRRLLLVESVCIPQESPVLYLRDEPDQQDQGLNSLGCYPSEGALVKMAYRAGFPVVYRFGDFPEHEEFREALGRRRSRTMLAASAVGLSSSHLVLAQEPKNSRDPWSTDPTGITKMTRRLKRFLARPWPEKVARLKRRYWFG